MSAQRGSGLLLLLVVLVAGAALYLAARDPGAARRAERAAAASAALAAARETLLARALVDRNRPGSLPCAAPDAGGSGSFHGNDCDADTGRFPFRTLETRPLRDGGGALLWYGLDPALRDRATQEPINPQARQGALSLDGVGHYAAVVVAPGEARPGQSRARGTRADYLDGINAAGTDFADCSADGRCNDIVRGISVDALFADVQRRVVAEVARALVELWASSDRDPRRRYLPYAAALGARECARGRALGAIATRDVDGDCGRAVLAAADLPRWLRANDWLDLVV
ncbi:MAG: hypothetical protein U5K43_05125 [Halofilum sp. (in: g-proteobacteria)]|nr:hypothetical protein [Halofilum sp. (in: g-proteobacteria)]